MKPLHRGTSYNLSAFVSLLGALIAGGCGGPTDPGQGLGQGAYFTESPNSVTVFAGGPPASFRITRGDQKPLTSPSTITHRPLAGFTVTPDQCTLTVQGSTCDVQVSAATSVVPGSYILDLDSPELGIRGSVTIVVHNRAWKFEDISGDLTGVFGRRRVTGESRALGANDAGQVVGFIETADGVHGFLWKSGATPVDLGRGSANAINQLGWVTGSREFMVQNPNNPGGPLIPVQHAYIWRPAAPNAMIGTFTDLATVAEPWRSSVGNAINDNGEVAGASGAPLANNHPFKYSGGTMRDLANAPDGAGMSINASGQVAGWVAAGTEFHAAVWLGGGSPTILHTVQFGGFSQARSINDTGQVAISAANTFGEYSGYLWESGKPLTPLLRNGSTTLSADPYGINNSGLIVGYGSRSIWGFVPGLYDKGDTLQFTGAPTNITDLVPNFITVGSRIAAHYDTGVGIPKACVFIPQ